MSYSRILNSLLLVVLLVTCASGEDPYRFYTWNVTYGDIYPLGMKQQVLCFLFLLCIMYCSNKPLFFFFTFCFANECNEYLVNEMAGNIDKRAVSRATDRICDQ